MNDSQFQEELSTIRRMIERTRRETFQSGYLFIIPGVIWLVAVIVMGTLEMTGWAAIVHAWGWTVFAVIALVSVTIGLVEGNKVKDQPQTYTRLLFSQLWGACAVVIVLIAFAVPHMNSYTPVAELLVVGLGFYVTGVIYELPMVQFSGVVLWIGMCALGFIEGNVRLPIWIATIFFGFILPGIMLNVQYRKLGVGHGE